MLKLIELTLMLGLSSPIINAQAVLHEQLWGTFIYNMYGDRTPLRMSADRLLTPLGAQQMYQAGAAIRARYITGAGRSVPSSTALQGIDEYRLNPDHVFTMSTPEQYVVGSAAALMQGLYPPLGTFNLSFDYGMSSLVNGTNVQAPLNGYQYAQIQTTNIPNDMNFIWIAGQQSCSMYDSSANNFYRSADYQYMAANYADFYNSLGADILHGVFPSAAVGYDDAYYIWDYLKYGWLHNTSISEHLAYEDYIRAHMLANDLMYQLNANISASGLTEGDHIRAIAGRTLAKRVLSALAYNIRKDGEMGKMTVLVGSFEPIMSLLALAGVASDHRPQFYGIPEDGASMIFELYSLTTNTSQSMPDMSELYVRFFYRNGGEDQSEMQSYPLFGRSPSQLVTWQEFYTQMDNFSIQSVTDWCTTCASRTNFCTALTGATSHNYGSGYGSSDSHGLKPAVAGAIGAIAALLFIASVLALLMLLGGIRFHRQKAKRRSELGGFKGGEKLASDQDLSLSKGAAGAAVVEAEVGATRGHERVGSWELRDQAKAEESQMSSIPPQPAKLRRPSFEDDDMHVSPFADPVKPHERV